MKKMALIVLMFGLFRNCNANAMDASPALNCSAVETRLNVSIDYHHNVCTIVDYIRDIVVGKKFYVDEKNLIGYPNVFDRITNNGAIAIGFVNDFPKFIFTAYGRFEIFSEIYSEPSLYMEKKVFLAVLFGKFELEIIARDHFYGGDDRGPVYSITRDLYGQPLPLAEMIQL